MVRYPVMRRGSSTHNTYSRSASGWSALCATARSTSRLAPITFPRGRSLFLKIVGNNQQGAVYRDQLFVNRTLYGLYRLFHRLGATVDLGRGWLS